MTKKKIFRWAKVLILLYSIIGIAAYYLQDKLLFHPEPVDRKTNYHFTQPYSKVNLPYNKETSLNVVQFKPQITVGVHTRIVAQEGETDN